MIQKTLAKDGLSKAFAVILALIVWVQVINDKNPLQRKDFAVEVKVAGLSQDTVVMSINPPKVSVTLEGRATTISRVDPLKLEAIADLGGKDQEDSAKIPLKFQLPNGVKLLGIEPKEVSIDVDSLTTLRVSCNVQVIGMPNEDFQSGVPVVSPDAVSVKGPSRLTSRVQWAQGVIDITGAVQNVTGAVQLVPRDSQGTEVKGVTLEPSSVQVQVPLTALPPAKPLPVHPKVVGSPKEGYRLAGITVTPEEVKVRASQSQLRYLTSVPTKPLDVSGKDATYMQLVTLDLPPGVTSTVREVTLRVEIVENIVERTFTVPVQITSYPSRLKWEIQPTTVEVILRGRSDILSQVAERDVEAYIDAEGKSEGEYDMVVAVKAPSGVQIDVRPPKVKLVLTKR